VNEREKRLAIAVGGIVGAIVLILLGRVVFLRPIQDVDRRIVAARLKLDGLAKERRDFFAAEEAVKAVAARTFSDDIDQASARFGEMLTRTIINSGLRESDFSRLPTGSRKLRGALETGWAVRGEGPLAQVISLVFLLDRAAPVHRLDGLTLSAGDSPGRVRVSFRYLTLVPSPSPDVERTELESKFTAESPERRAYDPLVARDVLRPYLRRPPPAPPAGQPAPPVAPAPPGSPGPETFRVVSLSEWAGEPEIHVRDLTAQKTVRYKVGDTIAGGVIVQVDYRPMPMPGREGLLSSSRVVLRIGAEYWAIERGGTFADRHKLKPEELPPGLAKS
jgi:hypothetical protein